MTVTRGTTNSNSRGNVSDRLARRIYLVNTYQANVDIEIIFTGESLIAREVPLGEGIPACRCYRCGKLLTENTVTVDRIVPGCKGGTYRRNNIRPACGKCNSETGARMRSKP